MTIINIEKYLSGEWYPALQATMYHDSISKGEARRIKKEINNEFKCCQDTDIVIKRLKECGFKEANTLTCTIGAD